MQSIMELYIRVPALLWELFMLFFTIPSGVNDAIFYSYACGKIINENGMIEMIPNIRKSVYKTLIM